MRRRCNNPNTLDFPTHGGRGISVCKRWDDFAIFLLDMGRKPSPKHSIDRIDNNGNYEPSNCRWATTGEQAMNTRRTHFVTFNGETMCVKQWAKKLGMKYAKLNMRFHRKWSVRKALTTP